MIQFPQFSSDFFRSKLFKRILIGIGVIIILLFTFQAGVMMGYRRGNFFHGRGERREIAMPGAVRGGFFREMNNRDLMKGHGGVGEITKIDPSALTIKEADQSEKVVTLTSITVIRRGDEAIKITDLKIGDHVIIVGAPNDAGQIDAKVIRVLSPLTFLPPHFFPLDHHVR